MVLRFLVLVVLVGGCVQRAKEVLAPEPEGGGTLSCREIVETCDSACSDPLCLHRCSPQGTPDARDQHDALLACGERAGCTDEACMRASCGGELETCMGPDAAPAAASEPAADPAAPSEPAVPAAPAAAP